MAEQALWAAARCLIVELLGGGTGEGLTVRAGISNNSATLSGLFRLERGIRRKNHGGGRRYKQKPKNS